ncbi:MAG: M24 family metallopeptidase [Haloplanus sp.]
MSVGPALSAAETGLVAVATLLADASVVDGRLHADSDADPLTPARLEAVADDATAADAQASVETRDGVVRPGDPLVVAFAPRVDGTAVPLSRTFVVDGSGGWERRAAVAVEMAHDAVRRVAAPGVSPRRVVDEAVAELGAYGLTTGEGNVIRGVGSGLVASAEGDASLTAGQRFVLDPAARDPDPDTDRGRIRIGGWYAVTDDGCRALSQLPTSLSPDAY